MPVTRPVAADHRSIGQIERREQLGDPITALVIAQAAQCGASWSGEAAASTQDLIGQRGLPIRLGQTAGQVHDADC